MKTIAIDLDSDGECEEHNNYLDESIDKVELNEKQNVCQSYENGDTALVSATKKLLNQVQIVSKPKNNDENLPIYQPIDNTQNTQSSQNSKNDKNIQFLQFEQVEEDDSHSSLTDITAKMQKINEQVKSEHCTKEILKIIKEEIIDRGKKPLEEIPEAENSEFESSTFDERMNSNIANASMAENSLVGHKYETLPADLTDGVNPDKLPILFIDVKISHDKIARLILYRNQTPVEAAAEFILKHNIPTKLRPYLVNKVQAHYEKVLQGRCVLKH
jgi:hypothetical protein